MQTIVMTVRMKAMNKKKNPATGTIYPKKYYFYCVRDICHYYLLLFNNAISIANFFAIFSYPLQIFNDFYLFAVTVIATKMMTMTKRNCCANWKEFVKSAKKIRSERKLSARETNKRRSIARRWHPILY